MHSQRPVDGRPWPAVIYVVVMRGVGGEEKRCKRGGNGASCVRTSKYLHLTYEDVRRRVHGHISELINDRLWAGDGSGTRTPFRLRAGQEKGLVTSRMPVDR